MRTYYVTVGLTLLFLTGAVVAADAKTQKVHCKGGGTFTDGVETNIDTNGDGASAGIDQGAQVCNIGRFVFQEEAEWIPQPTLTNCPAGTDVELHIDATHGQHRGVITDEETGDQAFGRITSATECFTDSTGTFFAWGQQETLGGTGQYTGATGTGSFKSAGSYLQFGCKGACLGPPFPVGGFGQFTFTSEGTLTLPKGGKGKED